MRKVNKISLRGKDMPTAFDNRWTALLHPGEATHYFNIDYSPLSLDASPYNNSTALWLAELSRLIYRKNNKENQFIVPSRSEILKKVSLRETGFFSQGHTHCSIIECQKEATQYPFAVLVFRGTQEPQNWLTNLNTLPTCWSEGGRVHRGFKKALEKVWNELEACLSTLQVPVFYTGHSLGAALATLAAARRPPHALYTFGTPRVGDAEFSKLFENLNAYRVVNHRDVVLTVPMVALGFCHVGELHYIAHNCNLFVAPSEDEVRMDRKKIDPHLKTSLYHRRWFDPPSYLFNHAPVNYVAHLERQLSMNWLSK